TLSLGSNAMGVRTRFEAMIKPMAVFASVLCFVGAAAAIYVVLVRIPVLANTKLELLLGTLQGVAVGLLFAIAALLISLTYMVRRASRLLSLASASERNSAVRASEPSA